MKKYHLNDFTKGWIIGAFTPSIFDTSKFEIAVKYYKQGDKEKKHYHRYATEYTIIAKGKAKFNDLIFEEKNIIVIDPLESVSFEALEDTITTVIKVPSILGDKFDDIEW